MNAVIKTHNSLKISIYNVILFNVDVGTVFDHQHNTLLSWKLLLTYNSYSLNSITMSFVFIWITVAHYCVLLTNSWILPSSKYYSTSLFCRKPTSNLCLMLDVNTNVIFRKYHRVWVLYTFHQNPICQCALPLNTHFTNTCGPLMSLESVPFLIITVCNCQRFCSNMSFNVLIHYHLLLYIKTHLIQ